ncbi:hypothetical protein [Flavobacterium sp.]|uniref:hypothetical protein n=1 Tax=Flavobacterium sp. TaxID=239 RepID=UPI00404744E6
MRNILFICCFLQLMISCKKDLKEVAKGIVTKERAIKNHDLSEAEEEVFNIKEVKEKNKFIDSISKGKHGISLISDSINREGITYYEINAGYNSEMRFENYFTFYVEKGNCKNIKISNVIDGEIISLSKWRNNNIKANKQEISLIESIGVLKELSLPFSFKKYMKDKYSEQKYPYYNASQYLIQYLIKKNYEAEKYECFVISLNKNKIFLVSVLRGDAEYFLILTSNNNKILDIEEIGLIGGDEPITFKISKDLLIEKYKNDLEENNSFEKYQIVDDGSIKKI